MKLPPRLSSKWYWLTALIFVLLFTGFAVSRAIFGTTMDTQNIVAFLILSAIFAILAGAGGFLGAKVFFATTALAYTAGLFQLLYIVAVHPADGWSDLTSVIGFLVIACGGLALGVLAQFILWIMRRKQA